MKGILFFVALLLAGVMAQGAHPVSAASLDGARLAAQMGDTAGELILAQGYGGSGSSDGGYRRRGSDDDDDDGGYRRRGGEDDGDGGYRRRRGGDDDDGYRGERRRHESRGDYCRRCAWRCRDGWCPPRCWGWWRQCRRDRYRD